MVACRGISFWFNLPIHCVYHYEHCLQGREGSTDHEERNECDEMADCVISADGLWARYERQDHGEHALGGCRKGVDIEASYIDVGCEITPFSENPVLGIPLASVTSGSYPMCKFWKYINPLSFKYHRRAITANRFMHMRDLAGIPAHIQSGAATNRNCYKPFTATRSQPQDSTNNDDRCGVQGVSLLRAYQKVKNPFFKRGAVGDVMLKEFKPNRLSSH
ncbi:hypothetical protein K492DRAFT_199109 [Lichtheimia hyalospora FSU 10163]|nr:hypothetical protein K492DRAFT_199109 [Lichtheimia hyalospora FSU 10163]